MDSTLLKRFWSSLSMMRMEKERESNMLLTWKIVSCKDHQLLSQLKILIWSRNGQERFTWSLNWFTEQPRTVSLLHLSITSVMPRDLQLLLLSLNQTRSLVDTIQPLGLAVAIMLQKDQLSYSSWLRNKRWSNIKIMVMLSTIILHIVLHGEEGMILCCVIIVILLIVVILIWDIHISVLLESLMDRLMLRTIWLVHITSWLMKLKSIR